MYMKRFRFSMIFAVIFMCFISAATVVVYADDMVTVYDSGYRGEGMVIAVIDSEFDLNHEMFVLSEDTVPRLTEDDIHRIVNEGLNCSNKIISGGMNPYISEKIPFAFDYTSGTTDTQGYLDPHGTHVAGIIGANNVSGLGSGFNGIAPEAQLILMKVVNNDGYFSNEAVYAAYDDALRLGADVINCSFGVDSGYAYGGLTYIDSVEFELTDNIYKSRIDLSAAAGNAGRIGQNSIYDELYGIKNPLAEAPDYGTAAAPSTFPHNISVANAHEVKNYKLSLSDGNEFLYEISNLDFYKAFKGQAMEYTVIPNLGETADYKIKGIDVKGKIAVVERGIITFDAKIEAAHKAGAVGIIIYNNIPGELDFTPSVTYDKIPYIILKQDVGLAMTANEADEKTVHFSDTFEPDGAIIMSSGSSWGVTSMLTFKPDITAFGTNIYSALSGNEYGFLSGTSMASPYISGCLALIKQHMRVSGIEVTDDSLPRKYLMSSAVPIINPESGIEYSPRVQGTGLVNIENACQLELLLWNEESGETKIELGEISDTFEIIFTAKNLSDRDYEYIINTQALTDGYFYHEESGKYFAADYSEIMKRTEITVRDNLSGVLTILAGETVEVVIEVKLDENDIRKYSRAFINGFFVEGFVYLENTDSKSAVSIPYMGFYGDWAEIPITVEGYYKTLPFTVTPSLGVSWDTEFEYANDIAILRTRDIIVYNMEILDSNGKTLEGVFDKAYDMEYFRKTIAGDEYFLFGNSLFWDGRDTVNPKYVYPDGEYTLVIHYSVPYKPEVEKILEISFIIDTINPEIISYTVEDSILILELSDNRYMRSVIYKEEIIMTDAVSEVSVEIDISADLKNEEDYIYLYLIDVAGNITVEKILV